LSRFAAEIDWERTQAFCHGTNAIRINLRGRERQGSVDPAEYDDVVDRLKRRLLALKGS
jgi:predicted AlkP superfamily phosphohydrolase/phosphomutase